MRPYLDFYLNLGVARIGTAIWRDALHTDCREYVMVRVEVWGHELFRFRLYETGISRYMRTTPK